MSFRSLAFVMLRDGYGIGWCRAGFGVLCRIPLRQSGWRVVHAAAQVLE